jgi:hypothetical protein
MKGITICDLRIRQPSPRDTRPEDNARGCARGVLRPLASAALAEQGVNP